MDATRHVLFIGGAWVAPADDARIAVTNPATGLPLGSVPAAGPQDAERAVAAARAAFPAWSRLSPETRGELLRRFADALESRAEEMAQTLTAEVGSPISPSRRRQVPGPVAGLRGAAALAEAVLAPQRHGNSVVVREPAGVTVAIAPWNFPLLLGMNKVSPALAVGCTVIYKPSEITPLHAFLLADCAQEAGLPPGVLNVLPGTGSGVGEALVGHPDVDVVSLTGSTAAGRRVAELAASTIKKVHLELGGKSASVVLDDADLPSAVESTVAQCFVNTGQTCLAWSRLLVPRQRAQEAAELAAAAAERYVVGDPADDATQLGPLVSCAQRERVWSYLAGAGEEGAHTVTGGIGAPDGLDRGWFVRPTVLAGVRPEMTVAREEVFGPVLVVMPYDDDDDAVRIANDTIYGLHGAVFSADSERATRVARQLRTGAVDINGGALNLDAPFGGYKQSGVGRELGRWGLEEYTELKSIQY